MPDTNQPLESGLSRDSLDEFLDVEHNMRWSREHTRSFGFLLGGLAIIIVTIALGLWAA
jgi:hypothetical protein